MKLLHIVAGNRWTGAAAPAFAEVAALRQAGVDAHFAYTGGYKLEAKIGHLAFTHPVIPKAQNPFSRSLRRLIEQENFDCVHAHLTYDHWLARLAGVCTMRTFHTHRTLRSDPFTRSLIRHSRLICVTNDALRDARPIRARNPLFTPPPIDLAQFRPEGADVRDRYGIARDALLLAAIGKLSKHRGFELVLQTFALLRKRVGNAHLMIVGHGEHRPELESLARDLGIGRAVTWAGYHEDDLADHYRAAGFLLFTAKGSDEGHRAVLEAMACGTVPVTAPLDGMRALLGDMSEALIAREGSAESLASRIVEHLDDHAELRTNALERSKEFGFDRAARRLIDAYSSAL